MLNLPWIELRTKKTAEKKVCVTSQPISLQALTCFTAIVLHKFSQQTFVAMNHIPNSNKQMSATNIIAINFNKLSSINETFQYSYPQMSKINLSLEPIISIGEKPTVPNKIHFYFQKINGYFYLVCSYRYVVEDWFINELLQNIKYLFLNFSPTSNILIKDVKLIANSINIGPKVKLPSESIIQHFVTRCDQQPQNIALIIDGKKITYFTLNLLSDQLSAHIAKLLPNSQTPIAVCINRSRELIIALLAILKTNNIYVPIDVDYPLQRQQYIVTHSEAALLISDRNLNSLNEFPANLFINIKTFFTKTKPTSSGYFIQKPNLDDTIAIYYTSGSTGLPKGVSEKYSGFLNRLVWSKTHYTLTNNDTALQIISIGFGISFFEILHPLLSGATLVISKQGTQRNPDELIHLILKHNVSFMHVVPTILNSLMNRPKFQDCKSLKQISCGGETLTREALNSFNQILSAKLYNTYGTTESSVAITHKSCDSNSLYPNISIGNAINNVCLYVLDENKNIVPKGSIGELYVGGICLANGYYKNIGCTKQKFIYHEKIGQHLYATGDLVQMLDTGEIYYCCRKDLQLKIKGCRIEPQEIIRQVRKISSFIDLIIAKITFNENIYLAVVFKATNITKQQTIEKIQQRISKFLPHFMWPTFYLQLNDIPKNLNGKIDYKSIQKRFDLNQYIICYQRFNRTSIKICNYSATEL